ncbi:hypothetical protein Vse01_38050 [Micromonospora sediminimaris]|uniref:Uncharacterized protein n=1 Tax=Micromonospora sediminimaris TaxID=547162 RepID=A0A9W5USB2_9ACTN|nr:hypothetical protein Vse01_38050 [Micromonospora sediminimaris]
MVAGRGGGVGPDVDPYHGWANVEFVGTDGSINEVDALVLTAGQPDALPRGGWIEATDASRTRVG